MKIKEYEEIIEATAVYPEKAGIAYTILGLIEESEEFENAYFEGNEEDETIIKELGDVLWYVTATLKEAGMKLSDLELKVGDVFDARDILTNAIRLAKVGKKFIRDNNLKEDILVDACTNIVVTIIGVCGLTNSTFEKCMEMNYDKLMHRRQTNTIHGDGDNR